MNIRSFNPKFWMLLLVTAQTGVVLPAIATSSATSPMTAREIAFDFNVTDLEGTTVNEKSSEPILIADRGNDRDFGRDVDYSVDYDRGRGRGGRGRC